jgi:hypothetical protein
MLAHLVHHRRSVLSAPSASAIRYATLHTSRRPTVSSKVFPTTRYPRGYHGCELDPWNQPDQDRGDLP